MSRCVICNVSHLNPSLAQGETIGGPTRFEKYRGEYYCVTCLNSISETLDEFDYLDPEKHTEINLMKKAFYETNDTDTYEMPPMPVKGCLHRV